MRLFLSIILATLFQWSCSSGNQSAVSNLSAADFNAAISKSTSRQLIDVRTDAEVSQGVIANARQVDISSPDFDQQLDQLDKNTPVYVYCAAGGRSAQAAQVLAQKGFKEIYNLTGGIQSWMQAGNPVNSISHGTLP